MCSNVYFCHLALDFDIMICNVDWLEKKEFCGCRYFWSIRCSRCKPCQVVLGEPGGIEHILGKGGNPDNQQRHLDLLLLLLRRKKSGLTHYPTADTLCRSGQ